MKDYKYALEIMKQEIENKYISPEIRYAFECSIEVLEKRITEKQPPLEIYPGGVAIPEKIAGIESVNKDLENAALEHANALIEKAIKDNCIAIALRFECESDMCEEEGCDYHLISRNIKSAKEIEYFEKRNIYTVIQFKNS